MALQEYSGNRERQDIYVDIWESAKVLGRRWYIVVPILATFALAAIFVGGQIDPEYRASASMVILPQAADDGALFQSRSAEGPSNPLDYLGGQTTLTGLQLIVGTEATRGELAAAGFSPSYSISVDAKDPLMLVEVIDRDPVVVQATVDELTIRVQEELDTLQATVRSPTSELLEIHVLNQTQLPTEDYGSRMRIRIILAMLGILAASGAALLTEAWSTGRAGRAQREPQEAELLDEPEPAEAAPDLETVPLDESQQEPDHDGDHFVAEDELERELVAAPGSGKGLRAPATNRGPQE